MSASVDLGKPLILRNVLVFLEIGLVVVIVPIRCPLQRPCWTWYREDNYLTSSVCLIGCLLMEDTKIA